METSSRTRSTRNNHKADHQSAAIDCFFFVFFGTCGFGPACKFNHPMLPSADEQEAIVERYVPPIGPPCKYFISGFCKHGTSCVFDHSFPTPLPNYSLHFNAYGFPKRWGMPDCSFYMRNGTCGYGTACKFHHPEPVLYYSHDQDYGSDVGSEVLESQRSYTSVSNGWYQRKPITITIREPCVTLNDIGLPLRPDKKACRNYENNGCCKYGKGCKFNHPMKGSIDDEKSPDNQE